MEIAINYRKLLRELKREGFKHFLARLIFGQGVYTYEEHTNLFNDFVKENIGREIIEVTESQYRKEEYNKLFYINKDDITIGDCKYYNSMIFVSNDTDRCILVDNHFENCTESFKTIK